MIRELTRLPLQQPLVTGGVAATHFASEAAMSYLGVISTQLLVSGAVRWQAAGLSAGNLLLGAGSARLQSHWRQNLEVAFQTSIVPFLRTHCAMDTSERLAHYSIVMQRLDGLAAAQAWLLLRTAGSLGGMMGSVVAALSGANGIVTPVFWPLLAVSVMSQGADVWWTQRTQQRHTDLAVEHTRLNYGLTAALAHDDVEDLVDKIDALQRNRLARYALLNAGQHITNGQSLMSDVGYYGVLLALGWFTQDASAEQLTGLQQTVAVAQSLVYALLTLPVRAVEQWQLRVRIRSHLTSTIGDEAVKVD